MNRRTILVSALSACLVSACGIAIPSDPATPKVRPTHSEDVSSIFVTTDNKKIIFVGRQYTYIFPAPPELIAAFNAPFHSQLRAHLGFVVSGSTIWGDVDLELPDSASEDQKHAAEAAGFRLTLPPSYYDRPHPKSSGIADSDLSTLPPVRPNTGKAASNATQDVEPKPSEYIFNRRVNMMGQRFGATDMTGVVVQSLNQTYYVTVTEADTGPVEPSPVRGGAGGLLLLAAIPLLPVILILGLTGNLTLPIGPGSMH